VTDRSFDEFAKTGANPGKSESARARVSARKMLACIMSGDSYITARRDQKNRVPNWMEIIMSGITLAKANSIIETALSTARANNTAPWRSSFSTNPGTFALLQREDGASMFRVDIATGKAWAFHRNGYFQAERWASVPGIILTFLLRWLPLQGASSAANGRGSHQECDGQILGAAGASGGTGDEDEYGLCMAGVEAAGLQHA